MYWQRKIELHKELEATLDPGEEELNKMRKEIHIMEQRLEELQRNQKKKIHDMEKAVSKREVILTKYIFIVLIYNE